MQRKVVGNSSLHFKKSPLNSFAAHAGRRHCAELPAQRLSMSDAGSLHKQQEQHSPSCDAGILNVKDHHCSTGSNTVPSQPPPLQPSTIWRISDNRIASAVLVSIVKTQRKSYVATHSGLLFVKVNANHLCSKQINKNSSSILRNPPAVKQEVPRTS